MATDIPTKRRVLQLIERASRSLRRHALLIGGALVAAVGDRLARRGRGGRSADPLATTFRLLFAVGFWLVLIAGTAVLLVWPALRRLKLEDVALRIEQVVGNMHNRLLTVLDLHRAERPASKQSNPDMVAALLRQTRDKLAGFRIRQIDQSGAAGAKSGRDWRRCCLAAVLLAVVFRESAPTALARILRPTADIPPVTWLQIAAPGDLAAPAGDPLTIGADVTRGEVDALSLHLQQPDGQWVVYPMQRDGEQQFFVTRSAASCRTIATRSAAAAPGPANIQIHMVPRPIVDAVATAIRLPALHAARRAAARGRRRHGGSKRRSIRTSF